MVRVLSESVKFIAQGHFGEADAVDEAIYSKELLRNPQLLAVSNTYGLFFLSRGQDILIFSTTKCEEMCDGGDDVKPLDSRSLIAAISLKNRIFHVSLSRSEVFLSVIVGNGVSIYHTPTLVREVSVCRCRRRMTIFVTIDCTNYFSPHFIEVCRCGIDAFLRPSHSFKWDSYSLESE